MKFRSLRVTGGNTGLPQRVACGFHFPYIFHQILGTTVMFYYRVPQKLTLNLAQKNQSLNAALGKGNLEHLNSNC